MPFTRSPVLASPPPATAALRFLVLTIFVDAIGFGIVLPVVPGLVMQLEGGSLAEATWIGGGLSLAYALMGFLLGPLMGNLGDRFGRRPVLLASLAGLALDYCLMAAAPSLAWLFVGRAIAGALGATYAPAYAAIADVSAADDRAKRFGYLSAAFGVGFVVGPAIGGLLGTLGPRAPFWVAAAAAGLNWLYGLFAFSETLPAGQRRPFDWARANPIGALRALRRLHGVLSLAAVWFLWSFATLVYPSTWAFFAIARFGWSPALIGASLAFTGLLFALIQTTLLARIVARLGERGAAIAGVVAGIVGFVTYAAATEGWMVFAIMLVSSFQCLVMPSLTALMSAQVPPDAQGELQGFNSSVNSLASIVGPLVLNPALAFFTGPAAPFRFPGAAFAISAAASLAALAMLLRRPARAGT